MNTGIKAQSLALRVEKVKKHFDALYNPEKAQVLGRFFKTGVGEYGHGDHFLGATVPQVRAALKLFTPELDLALAEQLLDSQYHEIRLFAVLAVVQLYQKANTEGQTEIYSFYYQNLEKLHNWDYIDASASHIVGHYLYHHPAEASKTFQALVASTSQWRRRAAILACFVYIKNSEFIWPKKVAMLLLHDHEDLIHKALGWMLRELGKKSPQDFIVFLQQNYANLPRTTLRYAIEKFDPTTRQAYLKGQF